MTVPGTIPQPSCAHGLKGMAASGWWNRENGGLSAARNTGMALAGGEYIGFVDPDDYVEHSMYGRLLEKARRSDADVTACGYTGFSDRDGSILEKWSLSPEEGVEENVQACVFQENAVWRRMAAVVA